MIKKRINTDLFLTIPILENNVEVNLSDVNNLHVYLSSRVSQKYLSFIYNLPIV